MANLNEQLNNIDERVSELASRSGALCSKSDSHQFRTSRLALSGSTSPYTTPAAADSFNTYTPSYFHIIHLSAVHTHNRCARASLSVSAVCAQQTPPPNTPPPTRCLPHTRRHTRNYCKSLGVRQHSQTSRCISLLRTTWPFSTRDPLQTSNRYNHPLLPTRKIHHHFRTDEACDSCQSSSADFPNLPHQQWLPVR